MTANALSVEPVESAEPAPNPLMEAALAWDGWNTPVGSLDASVLASWREADKEDGVAIKGLRSALQARRTTTLLRWLRLGQEWSSDKNPMTMAQFCSACGYSNRYIQNAVVVWDYVVREHGGVLPAEWYGATLAEIRAIERGANAPTESEPSPEKVGKWLSFEKVRIDEIVMKAPSSGDDVRYWALSLYLGMAEDSLDELRQARKRIDKLIRSKSEVTP